MNTLSALAAIGSATILLASCGGEPLDYSKNTEKSVFVWRDRAWAEHPGVALEGAPGTPKSARKALIGKIFRVTYQLEGQNYTFNVTFTSQTRCSVETNARFVVPDGAAAVEFTGATYTYKVDNNEGTEATLALSFDSAAVSNQCTLKLVFEDAFDAQTTFQQFRNSDGITIVPAGTRAAADGTWQVLEGI